ncbi:MAG TPA: pirin family protein [Kiritimatiellia bacterium]|nr:pirin family protein [Kiritimatiellia bacterium]
MNTSNQDNQIVIRKADERGGADFGWLKSRHSFSFGEYYDPNHMGFRSLRVINEDRVAGGAGFPTHPHRDMEIFSYVLEGALAHKDSMGNERILKPGQIQLMSAGRGVTHSEYNHNRDIPTHFLQIWIQPRERGLSPTYTEWHPDPQREHEAKILVISDDGRDGSATIHQDAHVYRIRLAAGETVSHELITGRGLWLQVMRGSVTFNAIELNTGDGAGSNQPMRYDIKAIQPAEALLFDLT